MRSVLYERLGVPVPLEDDALGLIVVARLSIRYLAAARTSGRPNRVVAEQMLAGRSVTDDDVVRQGKLVAGWKSYAASAYRFLTSAGQGKGGAKPTPQLRRWVAEHPDDDEAQLFNRMYPSKGKVEQ